MSEPKRQPKSIDYLDDLRPEAAYLRSLAAASSPLLETKEDGT